MEKPVLSAELKGKYILAPGAGVGEYHFKRFHVNLETITLVQADNIVVKGFPFLIKTVNEDKSPANKPAKT